MSVRIGNTIVSGNGGGGEINIDNVTITKNVNDEIQTVAVKESNTGNTIKAWQGSEAEYNAIAIKDPNTLYYIIDDSTSGGGNSIIEYERSLTRDNKTAPNIFNNKVTGLTGGYEVVGDYCYVCLKCNPSANSYVTTAIASDVILTGFPLPETAYPLECVVYTNNTGVSGCDTMQMHGCGIRGDGAVAIYHDKYTTSSCIYIRGIYKIIN